MNRHEAVRSYTASQTPGGQPCPQELLSRYQPMLTSSDEGTPPLNLFFGHSRTDSVLHRPKKARPTDTIRAVERRGPQGEDGQEAGPGPAVQSRGWTPPSSLRSTRSSVTPWYRPTGPWSSSPVPARGRRAS